jgi:hypothetical protein
MGFEPLRVVDDCELERLAAGAARQRERIGERLYENSITPGDAQAEKQIHRASEQARENERAFRERSRAAEKGSVDRALAMPHRDTIPCDGDVLARLNSVLEPHDRFGPQRVDLD